MDDQSSMGQTSTQTTPNVEPKGAKSKPLAKWIIAIIIVAVVIFLGGPIILGALFSLGVFNPSTPGTTLGSQCIAAPGYLCQDPALGDTGVLMFLFGQNTGETIYNVTIGVAPYNSSINMAGFPTSISQTHNEASVSLMSSMLSGQTLPISVNLPISYTISNSYKIGSIFNGYVWLNYSTVGPSSPATTAVKVATISVKVT